MIQNIESEEKKHTKCNHALVKMLKISKITINKKQFF
jgi:hypothetical protein